LVKRRRGAAILFAGIGAGIEATEPLPSVLIVRLAYAARYGADMNVAEKYVPAILALWISAAG